MNTILSEMNKKWIKRLMVFGLGLIAILGCEDDRYTWEIDDDLINEYLKETGIEATKHDAGFYYVIERTGNGRFPNLSNNVEIRTLGYNLDSLVFQEKTDPVRLIPLSSGIAGFQYGIPLFDIGSKGKLFLPRSLGYGVEVLIFEVEVLNIW